MEPGVGLKNRCESLPTWAIPLTVASMAPYLSNKTTLSSPTWSHLASQLYMDCIQNCAKNLYVFFFKQDSFCLRSTASTQLSRFGSAIASTDLFGMKYIDAGALPHLVCGINSTAFSFCLAHTPVLGFLSWSLWNPTVWAPLAHGHSNNGITHYKSTGLCQEKQSDGCNHRDPLVA